MSRDSSSLDKARAALLHVVASERENLTDLLHVLGLERDIAIAHMNDAVALIEPALTRLLSQPLDDDDKVQLRYMLLHLAGRLLIERHDGMWMINKDPQSRHYGTVVIGAMRDVPEGTSIHPGTAADDLMAGVPLSRVLEDIERELGVLPR